MRKNFPPFPAHHGALTHPTAHQQQRQQRNTDNNGNNDNNGDNGNTENSSR
jgi:hypothetical protein